VIDVLDTEWKDSILLEMEVAKIIREQQVNGWLLDTKKCQELIDELEGLLADTDNQILPFTKPRVIGGTEVAEPFKKDGNLKEVVKRYFEDSIYSPSGPFTKIEFEVINLGSVKQVKDYLYSIGWVPDEWNEDDFGNRTSPKLTTTSLLKLGKPGELLDHRTVLTHRRNQIAGFLRNVRKDGRIEARANTLGAGTHRMTQTNVVNVPKAEEDVFFGEKMRSVFIVPDGYDLVGGDAAGLENRMIVHYLNNPDLIKVFTVGDFHMKWLEANKAFLSRRSVAKTSEYAFFFEAKDWKLGDIADIRPPGMSKEDIGKQIRENVDKLIPGLNNLIAATQEEAKKGWIKGLDGRKIRIRHSPFNSKIQSAGAIFMKRVWVFLMSWIKGMNLDAKLVGTFHDEGQLQVRSDQSLIVKMFFEQAIREAAVYYKLRCPMEGVVKIGKSWDTTH
jgi:DNA polymerase I